MDVDTRPPRGATLDDLHVGDRNWPNQDIYSLITSRVTYIIKNEFCLPIGY